MLRRYFGGKIKPNVTHLNYGGILGLGSAGLWLVLHLIWIVFITKYGLQLFYVVSWSDARFVGQTEMGKLKKLKEN